ncbi:hypothetical protein EV356DRAFT_537387 [Viridothelium virens]|uniref:Uncharacterized protein n=1 Tax=Viridothelium virens TaxID=1048519 RepID=A0A6A6GUG6_VIRVR|nr:hypothetical protein EV356DRAFT_537387 [Viridothelium virens]
MPSYKGESVQTNTDLTRQYHEKYSTETAIPSFEVLTQQYAPEVHGRPLRLTDTSRRVFKGLLMQSKASGGAISYYLKKKKSGGEASMRLLILTHPVAAQVLIPIIGAFQAVDLLFQSYCVEDGTDSSTVFDSFEDLEPLEYLASKTVILVWRRILIDCISTETAPRRDQLYSDLCKAGFGSGENQADGHTRDIYTLIDYFLDLAGKEEFAPSIPECLPHWCIERLRARCDILTDIQTKLLSRPEMQYEERMPKRRLDGNGSQGLRRRGAHLREHTSTLLGGENPQEQVQPSERDILADDEQSLPYAQNVAEREALPRNGMLDWMSSLVERRTKEKLTQAISERACVLLATLLCSVIAAATASLAAFRQTSQDPVYDSGFYFALAQCVVSLGSTYLTAVPILRSRAIRRGYTFWWRLSLGISAIAAIISCPVYIASSAWSGLLGLISGLAQLAATLQLVECFQASEVGLVS